MKPHTHLEEIQQELNELLDLCYKGDKIETLIYQRGLLSGWLARIATTDNIVHQEIRERLHNAKRKTSP